MLQARCSTDMYDFFRKVFNLPTTTTLCKYARLDSTSPKGLMIQTIMCITTMYKNMNNPRGDWRQRLHFLELNFAKSRPNNAYATAQGTDGQLANIGGQMIQNLIQSRKANTGKQKVYRSSELDDVKVKQQWIRWLTSKIIYLSTTHHMGLPAVVDQALRQTMYFSTVAQGPPSHRSTWALGCVLPISIS